MALRYRVAMTNDPSGNEIIISALGSDGEFIFLHFISLNPLDGRDSSNITTIVIRKSIIRQNCRDRRKGRDGSRWRS